MEHTVAVLTSFPPDSGAAATEKKYDAAAKGYLKALSGLSAASRAAIAGNPAQVLQVLDPAVNSIGYLAVLDILLGVADSERKIERGVLLDKTLEFLQRFDPYQIRYVGSSFTKLLEQVGSARLFTPLVAVELLARVILKLDPSGSVFTSTHLLLAKLAFDTNNTEPALAAIDRDVVFYPNMAGTRDPRPLCNKDLEPTAYISTSTGLTSPLKSPSVLEYNLLCGMIHISRRDWPKAQRALERAITHPSKDKGVSKIMLESYKKWVLVGLLHLGEAPTLPSYTSPAAKQSYMTLAPQYNSLAEQFSTTNAAQIKTEVEASAKAWADDGNASLVAHVVRAYQKWQIINLRCVYQNVPVSTVQRATLSAETGEPLPSAEAVSDLIQGMIQSGMLRGRLDAGAGGESYLTFEGDQASMAEADFAREIARSHRSIEALGRQYRLTNERLSSHKDYVRHLVREQKRLEKDDGDAGVHFESQVEDEDLMTGIVTHS